MRLCYCARQRLPHPFITTRTLVPSISCRREGGNCGLGPPLTCSLLGSGCLSRGVNRKLRGGLLIDHSPSLRGGTRSKKNTRRCLRSAAAGVSSERWRVQHVSSAATAACGATSGRLPWSCNKLLLSRIRLNRFAHRLQKVETSTTSNNSLTTFSSIHKLIFSLFVYFNVFQAVLISSLAGFKFLVWIQWEV